MRKKTQINYLLKPHWAALTLAFVAVIGESVTDLLEPWPLKVVFDNVLGSKRLPDWLPPVGFPSVRTDKFAVLTFAAASVIVIAVLGALSSYFEKYLTTSVAQWVSHDLRRTLYSHIQRLSLAYHDQKQSGDLISRVTSDIDAIQSFINTGLLSALINAITLAGMIGVMFYI